MIHVVGTQNVERRADPDTHHRTSREQLERDITQGGTGKATSLDRPRILVSERSGIDTTRNHASERGRSLPSTDN